MGPVRGDQQVPLAVSPADAHRAVGDVEGVEGVELHEVVVVVRRGLGRHPQGVEQVAGARVEDEQACVP
ncbi:hypothetical protein AB0C88_12530 [Streptomyces chartreusis]|uniref:hypothetical protein n=1 Tax=Streptomyces chartreusis TaxID=1969 RepID=UPI0033FD8ADF